MLNEFRFEGSVRSEPILCSSKKTGNSFVKFTIRNDPTLNWWKMQRIKERWAQGERNYGQAYIDCFVTYRGRENNLGKYALENVHKGCLIRACGSIRSGRKPIKEEGDPYRAIWVYGDYLYVNINKEI